MLTLPALIFVFWLPFLKAQDTKCNPQIRDSKQKLYQLAMLIDVSVTMKNHEGGFLRHETALGEPLTDRITLQSGNVCKYSNGFCYDGIEVVFVEWIPDYLRGNGTCLYRRIDLNAMRRYSFMMKKNYVIFDNGTEALALEVSDSLRFCGTRFRSTTRKDIALTSVTIEDKWNNTRLQEPQLTFVPKKELFALLVEECRKDDSNLDKTVETIKRSIIDNQNRIVTMDKATIEDITRLQYVSYTIVGVLLFIVLYVCVKKLRLARCRYSGRMSLGTMTDERVGFGTSMNVYEYVQ